MNTKDKITGALILGACLIIGDKLWTIALAAVMILAALALQGVHHGKTTRHPAEEA